MGRSLSGGGGGGASAGGFPNALPQETVMAAYNLPANYTEASVTAMFSVFGTVLGVVMAAPEEGVLLASSSGSIIDPSCARATVTFADPETARMAQQTMNNFLVGAHKLRCILLKQGQGQGQALSALSSQQQQNFRLY